MVHHQIVTNTERLLPQVTRQKENLRIIISDPAAAPAVNDWLGSEEIFDSRLLFSHPLAKQISETFPLNSKVGSTIEEQELSIKKSNTPLQTQLILQKESLLYELEIGQLSAMAEQEQRSLISKVSDHFESLWKNGTDLSVDVPRWEELLANLREIAGAQVEKEYRRLVNGAAAKEIYSLDEISLIIVAGASAGALNYDIGEWCKKMNIASKATISRRKKELETKGVVTTEKVPVEVGRPRQRLKLSPRVEGSIMGRGDLTGEIFLQDSETDHIGHEDDETKPSMNLPKDKLEGSEQGDRKGSDVIEQIRSEIIGVISAEDD